MLRRSRPFQVFWLLAVGALGAGCAGRPVAADPTGATFVERALAFLANPNVAYMLLVLGLLALVAELAAPGATAPGVIGVILLVLSLYGLLQLPTNWLGPVLIVTGIVMLLVDIKVTGMALSIGGVITFLVGSLLIFTPPWVGAAAEPVARLNPFLVAGTTLVVGLFFILGLTSAIGSQGQPAAVGRETLVGKTGVVRQAVEPADAIGASGVVVLEGEEWRAESATGAALPAGTVVRIVAVDGLRLMVEAAADAAAPAGAAASAGAVANPADDAAGGANERS